MDKQKGTFTGNIHIILIKTEKQMQKIKTEFHISLKRNWSWCWYLLFASDLSQMVENIYDISYSPRRFFDLGGQVDARHGNNLERR